MRHDGDGAQKVSTAPTLSDQKPQEHAESCRAAFCGRPSSRSTLLQYELAQARRIQITWVLANAAEQFTDA
jgi:hypothetical protein